MATTDPIQVAMYIHRSKDGEYHIALESLEHGFGFPAAITNDFREVFDLMHEVGAKLNGGETIRSANPALTLRLSRYGKSAPDDDEFREARNLIDRGWTFELVTYNTERYFNEVSGEMLELAGDA